MNSLEIHKQLVPRHIAIIMDGNGRWAQKRGLARHIGHEQGAKTAEDIIRYAYELGIEYVTLYAFSSENWQRPHEEVSFVMGILENYLRQDVDEFIKNGIKISAIGNMEKLPLDLRKTLDDILQKTAHCKKFVIVLALSYGGWEEIIHACKAMVTTYKSSDINEQLIRKHLYTNTLPDPDLFIRTGGEIRLSNFLLLQLSYSELYFSPVFWPDFQRADLDKALYSFSLRKRRFGAI